MTRQLKTLWRHGKRVPHHANPLARRVAVAVLVMNLTVVALARHLGGLDIDRVNQAFAEIPLWSWGLAALAAAMSFWGVGQYDRVIHLALGTGVRQRRAGRAGILAIALAQTLGLGALTGSLIRWRLLPELGMKGAAKVSALVALSFLIALAPLLSAAILFGGHEVDALKPAATGVAIACLLILPLLVWPPAFAAQWPRPSRAMITRMLGLVTVDVGGAALCLYLLLPAGEVSFADFLPVYALALSAGLVAGTPAGAGAFELTLLALLPMADSVLVASILAYRVIYYLAPALLAAIFLALIEFSPRARLIALLPRPASLRGADGYDRGEAQLARFAGRHILTTGSSALLTARAGSSLVAIGPALDLATRAEQAISDLEAVARHQLLSPCLYKCDSRLAAEARLSGWKVLRIAEEAVVDTFAFDVGVPERRQLRRKLRKAEDASVVVRAARPADLAKCREIAREWEDEHGRERGFSMGGVAGLDLGLGPVFVAAQSDGASKGDIIAFVSFLAGRREWALDLMRHRADLPEGTMYALVTHALGAARKSAIRRVSLAAVPSGLSHVPYVPDRLRARFAKQSGAQGLRQFKSSFAPAWENRYLAAPGVLAMTLAGIAILRQVTAPPRKLAEACKIVALPASGERKPSMAEPSPT